MSDSRKVFSYKDSNQAGELRKYGRQQAYSDYLETDAWYAEVLRFQPLPTLISGFSKLEMGSVPIDGENDKHLS